MDEKQFQQKVLEELINIRHCLNEIKNLVDNRHQVPTTLPKIQKLVEDIHGTLLKKPGE